MYLALYMAVNKKYVLEREDLLDVFLESNINLPHHKSSREPKDLLFLIEERSAVLIKRSSILEKNISKLKEQYEFQHTTFLEYLSGCAIVAGHYPNARQIKNPDARISAYFKNYWEDESMREIIIFTATIPWTLDIPQAIVHALLDKREEISKLNETDKSKRLSYINSILQQIIDEGAVLLPEDKLL